MSNRPTSAQPLEFDFVPNQLQLLVRHGNAPNQAQFDNLRGALNTQLGLNLSQRGAPLTFSVGGQPAFSVLSLSGGLPSAQARNIQPLINGLNNLPEAALPGLLQAAGFSPRAEAGARPGRGRALVAEPNWFTISSSHGQGTGGTGSWPLPANPTAPDPSTQAAPQINGSAGQAVTVALLDTHLTSAGQQNVSASLLSRLAFVMPMPASVQADIAGHHVNGHQYQMTSHGMFAAYQTIRLVDKLAAANSIVNPGNISINLYEALNNAGVGSAAWIYEILQTLSQQLASSAQRMVINLSLVLHAPTDQATILETICNTLEGQGAVLVAAAGNEAQRSYNPGPGRPAPMQPAAFGSVIGVAALAGTGASGFASAPYSNLSDSAGSPHRAGFAAIGGGSSNFNASTEVFEASAPEVNGPFVDAFPSGAANTHNWAYWSGTSFAAPRLSALAAVLLSTGGYAANSAANRQAIETAINSLCVTSYTADNEPKVEQ